jgi:hypothetical protein
MRNPLARFVESGLLFGLFATKQQIVEMENLGSAIGCLAQLVERRPYKA